MLPALILTLLPAAPAPVAPEPVPAPVTADACPCLGPCPGPCLDRFPPRWYVWQQLAANRLHRAWLVEQLALHPADPDWQDWYEANERLHAAWDALDWAWLCDHPHDHEARSHWLETLRGLVGAEAFWAGRMPPAVPVWRFRRVE